MSLYRRKGTPYWWTRFTHNGRRICESTGTDDRRKAQQYHDQLKAKLWEQDRLGVKPERFWSEAVVRWLQETKHKATHDDDVQKLRWLDPYLRDKPLTSITRDLLSSIADRKARETSGANANRYMALVRAILRRAMDDWEWIERVPKVRMYREAQRRVRWLTREQAIEVLKHLPEHQRELMRFALATGLRQGNILRLEWSQVDLVQRCAWIHADQAKARKAIGVPLNDQALTVLSRQVGKHERWVFTFRGQPIKQANTRAWGVALEKAGVENFRWHDLRHTWASWLAQAGASLYELQELGGWSSAEMVRRYAHLAPSHLAKVAARLDPIAMTGTKSATAALEHGAAS